MTFKSMLKDTWPPPATLSVVRTVDQGELKSGGGVVG